MNITVYLRALKENESLLEKAVKELGIWIGKSGNTLVYGGSKTGLMGKLVDSTLSTGGKVIMRIRTKIFYNLNGYYDSLKRITASYD